MPVPHFNIKITQRSKGNSAVAGAAYQAGEKLFSEYDQKTKNYTCKKEVVYTEIMLPPNAPPEYADRATLWNSVEEIEKQWNSQLARRFVAALPREVPMELLPQMVKEYCEEQFVSKGMCCDFAIHDPDPPGHNPHCHFMLTIHNYFFAKAIDQVRPGGIVAFVTSRYTMDSKDSTARKHIAERANLLGAIRLPNNAFKANAGTEVVSDIIFLQKRDRPADIEPPWVQLGKTEDGFAINQYFVDNPEMILGELTTESTQYGREEYGHALLAVQHPPAEEADTL